MHAPLSNVTRHALLTDELVAGEPHTAPGGRRRIIDTKLAGFRLDIGSATKVFRIQWDIGARKRRLIDGKRRTVQVTVGRFAKGSPDHIGVREARNRAEKIRADLKAGMDPTPPAPPVEPGTVTIGRMVESFIASLREFGAADATIINHEGALTRGMSDLLRSPVSWLGTDAAALAIKARHDRLKVQRFTKVKENGRMRLRRTGGPAAANQFVRSLKVFYRHVRGQFRSLPAEPPIPADAKIFPDGNRSASALTLDQLAGWHAKVTATITVQRTTRPRFSETRQCYLLLGLLSALRPGQELARLERRDVDEEGMWLAIREPKRARRDGGVFRPWRLPMSRPILAVVRRAMAAAERDFPSTELLFPYRDQKLRVVPMPKHNYLRQVTGASGHDLRHTFVSVARGLGHHDADIDLLLHHRPASTTGRYGDATAWLNVHGRKIIEQVNREMIRSLTHSPSERNHLGG